MVVFLAVVVGLPALLIGLHFLALALQPSMKDPTVVGYPQRLPIGYVVPGGDGATLSVNLAIYEDHIAVERGQGWLHFLPLRLVTELAWADLEAGEGVSHAGLWINSNDVWYEFLSTSGVRGVRDFVGFVQKVGAKSDLHILALDGVRPVV
jgi:hypothetical protein